MLNDIELLALADIECVFDDYTDLTAGFPSSHHFERKTGCFHPYYGSALLLHADVNDRTQFSPIFPKKLHLLSWICRMILRKSTSGSPTRRWSGLSRSKAGKKTTRTLPT